MDDLRQRIEQVILKYLENNETFRNKIKESIEQNIDIYSLMLNEINSQGFREATIVRPEYNEAPDNLKIFHSYLEERMKIADENTKRNLNIILELVACAEQQIVTDYKNELHVYKISSREFANTIKEVSTELQRQQAHQEQNEINNDLESLSINEDAKEYLISKIQENNNLYNIINNEIENAKKQKDEQELTVSKFHGYLRWQLDKRNKEFNNKSEEEKNKRNDMRSLFHHLNYDCGKNISKMCESTTITKFMTVFKKLSNIVIREQKILNDISSKLENNEIFKQLTQNAEQSEGLYNSIEDIKTNILNNEEYIQHYSENGSYGFYKFLQDHQDANNNNDTAIQLLNIVFENIENNKNIELYNQININSFLDLINDVPVTGRWALKKIEESPGIQKYLIGRFGTNKDLYNNIKDEIKRINGQNISVTEFRNHLLYNKRTAKQKSKKEKKKINDMYSLFHNIVDQSPEVTNTKECEYVKVIDLMDLLEKVNQKSKQPEQQRQQQQITKQQYQKQPEPKQELEETEEEFEEFEELEEELEESACELSVSLQQQLQKPTPMLNIPSNKALSNDNTASKMNVQLENIGQCKEVKIPCKAGCYYLLFDK